MNTVFVGGSRRLSRLNIDLRARLDSIVERGLRVVVGDANGGDRAVQAFFAEKGHKDVVVYCMEDGCRNNLGGWPVQMIKASGQRGFDYYSIKDVQMALAADCGFMIWDAKSKGTFSNIRRLVELRKPVVVYFSPNRKYKNVRTQADVIDLVSACSLEDRQRLSGLLGDMSEQVTLFPSQNRPAG